MENEMIGKYVMITTEWRGVFAGELVEYTDPPAGSKAGVAVLKDVRNCIKWRHGKGFLALAGEGPNGQCKIGPTAPKGRFVGVTGVFECSGEAAEKWRTA